MLITYATDYAMSGGNIHLITPNLNDHPYSHDVDQHEFFTCQVCN